MTPRDLARRFVAGHHAAAAFERQRLLRQGFDPAQTFADAMALLDAVAELGPLAPALMEARRSEEEAIRARWAKIRARRRA